MFVYQAHEYLSQSLKATFNAAAQALALQGKLVKFFSPKADPSCDELAHNLMSSARILEHIGSEHPPAAFGLKTTKINGQDCSVSEETLVDKPFGRLLHFKCEPPGPAARHVPKILLLAPISGHKATILRDTVRDLLPDSDVYVAEWKDAREVPLKQGFFDLDTYFDYVQDYLHEIGPQAHLIGISQSTVPALSVTSLMAARKDPCTPMSMTLMCGPIDPSIKETEVSRLTRQQGIDWLRQNVIMPVPQGYAGAGRPVYPGFVQSAGIMMVAPQKQHQHPLHTINELFRGQGEKLDADAPYYLQMIEDIFIKRRLARGTLTSRNEKIDPGKIDRTGLLVVEGSNDNITAPGQTKAAHDLCKGIPDHLRDYQLVVGAGHYDVFSGPLWESNISNKIKYFIRKIAAFEGIAYDPPQVAALSKAAPIQSQKPALAA
ncbi:MAG: polyhydroxyalkanoate depolymerase [Micavibrio aeruginosavorus]|uniref:Polyhydroxyalkanoate depolymerase n=1 Tax=Micavibrio aeruginosavorus TaxID=349221 RepID=A0A7T5R126_9BACT|nr:MAG: polyhydroxyalkanoate depolymerase [Micavibrio aeruginosavorus]